MRSCRLLFVVLLSTFIACGGDDDPPATDSGTTDSGAIDSGAIDSGAIDSGAIDSGPGEDSGRPEEDAAMGDAGECTPEGQSHAVVPSAPDCCPGLMPVGCDTPAGDGACDLCTGATFCTACGDGACGLEENFCRCPADCPAPG